jgi:hypothetical protein
MKKLFNLISAILFCSSCNDGDIVLTNFDFDDQNLEICGDVGDYVFFKVNTSIKESISLRLNTTDVLFTEPGIVAYILNESNFVNYRKFSEDVSSSYFCNNIPPTSPLADQDYIATSGTALLTTEISLDDNDSIEEAVDNTDTDEDGLLNYYDFDDDGDNIPTAAEIGPNPLNPRDSDSDGIPDYLDEDDDNDLILTRNEDLNMNLNPLDDISEAVPDYLNPNIAVETTTNEYILHTYQQNSAISLLLKDLVLRGSDEQLIVSLIDLGVLANALQGTVAITPDF